MFFEEYSEFIEALYCVRYSKRNEEEKLNSYKEIYNDYIKFGEVNKDFEEIYNDIITGVVYTLKACDLEFLRVYNGLLLSISKLLRLKVKIHYLEELTYIDKVYVVQGEERNYHCLQCDNKNQKLFFSYETEGIKITYCKRCLEFGRCDNYFLRFYINIPFNKINKLKEPPVILSDVQKEASEKIVENSELRKNTLIWAVCGAGKTEIVYKVIYNNIKNNKKVCMAIPRKDVVQELARRFNRDFRDIPISVLHGDEKKLVNSCFYLMTTHQLIKYYNYFDIVIVDEVDAFPYYGDECLEQGVITSLKNQGTLVFLSATPSDKVKKLVDEIIKIPIRFHGYLLPIPKIKIEQSKVFTYEKKSQYITQFITRRLELARRLLIFAPTIAMSKSLKLYLEKSLVDDIVIDFVYSEDEKRSEKLEKFKKWETDILITTTILERGVTFDYLDVLVFEANHKIFTKEALIQIAGRVGRKEYDYSGEIVFLADKINKNMKLAIKEINYMNNLAKYRRLNKE